MVYRSRSVGNVTVHPVALFSILDHFLRRRKDEDRVIGTLLGSRSDNTVEIKSSFAVPYKESAEQFEVDFEYLKAMFDLHQKVNPREIIVGWYSTGSDLNSYSALLQNFFSDHTAPVQAVHLLVGTAAQKGSDLGVKAFVSAPVGVTPRSENCVFVPVPCELRFHQTERNGLELLLNASKSPNNTSSRTHELAAMEKTLQSVIEMIDRVLGYVKQVVSGEVEGNEKIGRALLDALNETTDGSGLEKGQQLDVLFNSHLQDTLMVSYLASLVRSQVEVSTRLALVV
ncbi:Mov34-domain-containing protein [Clavulina sp. PMI_390]|nr:Mov34-domain-containing protein [Clavulina sp. PMI_390]